jgi:hypothetical protein
MEVAEFETEIVRKAFARHQESMQTTEQLLNRFAKSSESAPDSRRDSRFPRYSICTKIRATPCSSSFAPIGPAEVGFTQNVSAGGASIILPDA